MNTPRPGFHDAGAYALAHDIFQYSLPEGLKAGTWVRITAFDHGYCTVKDKVGNVWGAWRRYGCGLKFPLWKQFAPPKFRRVSGG
jgi:hypothetical protein